MKLFKIKNYISQKMNGLFFLCLVSLLFYACKHYPLNTDNIIPSSTTVVDTGNGSQNLNPCDPDSVYFNNTILPLMVSNCAKSGCHDQTTQAEGLILNSYSNIMASGEIKPGQPTKGDIIKLIKSTDPSKVMPPPPNSPLTTQQINQISIWIGQGATNNNCSSCDTNNVSYTSKIKPLLDLKCKGCHNPNLVSGGVDLSTYSGAVASSQNGALLGSVLQQAPYKSMPQGGAKLPACELDIIRIWITNQYPQ